MLTHDQVEEIKVQAYVGCPSELPGVCFVKPFTMEEIIQIGVNRYNGFLGLLLLNEVEIADIIKDKTGQTIAPADIKPLSYLIQSAAHNDSFLLELQTILSTFVQEKVLILSKINSVLIGNPEERRLLNEANFRDFQDILRIQNRKEYTPPPPPDETYGERKMRLLREKTAAVKRKQALKNGADQSLADLLEIAETYGIDVKHTIYAFYGLLRRHQAKEKWNQDIQMLCAGADKSKMKIRYWGENLDE